MQTDDEYVGGQLDDKSSGKRCIVSWIVADRER